jgi:hypothetical protein
MQPQRVGEFVTDEIVLHDEMAVTPQRDEQTQDP